MKYHIEFDLELKKNLYPGKLIVIEGIDGSGKTTQAQKVTEALNRKGIKSILTKEPTDEMTGKLIRQILSGETNLPQVAFQYLFSADRAVHQAQIEDYLKSGITVVSDRYFWSSVVYGMVDKGIDFGKKNGDRENLLVALSILSMYHQFLLPDFSFALKVSVATAIERIKRKDKHTEIYEKENKLEKLAIGYDWLTKQFPKEIMVLNGEKSVEEVTEEIVASIK
ncbi:MAG: dTMP kinase [Candidatus Levybacteria bacterium]|nr:dTMP kinase [Candidatus Levybacteria bacterium]